MLAAHPDQTHFVCASAGNHAQGVAYACRHFGVQGTIFMPVTTPQQKIDKTRTFGGDAVEIVLTGDYFDQTLAAAQAFCAERQAHFLSPFDDPDVIEGQASVGGRNPGPAGPRARPGDPAGGRRRPCLGRDRLPARGGARHRISALSSRWAGPA